MGYCLSLPEFSTSRGLSLPSLDRTVGRQSCSPKPSLLQKHVARRRIWRTLSDIQMRLSASIISNLNDHKALIFMF